MDTRADGRVLLCSLLWACASLGVGVLPGPAARAELGFKGDLELFRELALAQRDNAERISSWQGSSRVEVTRTDSSGVMLRDTSAHQFIYAREHDATRWNWTPGDRYTRQGGELVADPLEDKKLNEMRKGDAFYKYNLGVATSEGGKRGALVIWPAQKAEESAYSSSFDPMWYLTGAWTGWDDMATGLMEYYRQVRDPDFTRFAGYTLTRDGPVVTLAIENPTAEMTNRYVFDLSKGGTLVRYHATMKKNVQTIEWTYEEKEGIWIPKTCTKTIERNPPARDGCTKYIRTVTFIESALNHPVSASEFSLDKLGLKIGDLVSDHKLGLRYEYGGLSVETPPAGKLPEDKSATEMPSDAQSAAPGEDDAATPGHSPADMVGSRNPNSGQESTPPALTNTGRGFAVWFLVLLAAGGAGFVLLRRRRKARAE